MKLAVVSGDQEEALRVESGRRASIASVAVVAGLDADALALEPGGVLGEVTVGPIVGATPTSDHEAYLFIQGDKDGGGERLAAERL